MIKNIKEKSSHAQVAALCKSYLKSKGIFCKVSSQRFSGGNSVDVCVEDLCPETMEVIEEELEKYEYGSFDGMTDMYNHDNVRPDIPQVKYLHIQNEISEKTYAQISEFLKADGIETDAEARNRGAHSLRNLCFRLFTRKNSDYWVAFKAGNADGPRNVYLEKQAVQ